MTTPRPDRAPFPFTLPVPLTAAHFAAVCRYVTASGFHTVHHYEDTGRVTFWVDGADARLLAGLEEEFASHWPLWLAVEWREGGPRVD